MDFAAFARGIGRNIKAARLAAKLTQEDAADGIVSPKYLQAIEAGQKNITIRTLLALTERLQTPPAALFDQNAVAIRRARERMRNAAPLRRGRKPKRPKR